MMAHARRSAMGLVAGCTFLLALPGARRASAQDASRRLVPAGARVRLHSPSLGPERRAGTVLPESRDDSLVLRPDGTADRLSIPIGGITSLEVSVGRRSRTKLGSVLGALGGGAVGFLTAGSGCGTASDAGACSTGNGGSATASHRFEETVTGAVLGAAVGAIAGHFWKTESWVPIAIPAAGR